jgi:MFS family permease
MSRFTSGFRALRQRNYRLYWLGQLVSQTGTWMQTTAQAWLVLQLTSSPFAIGLVAVFQFLPVTLFALLGGAIADRVPRYRLILITQTFGLMQAAIFGLLVGTGLIQLWQVYLLALTQGLITAVDQPVRQAFAVTLVEGEDRANAIALNSMMFNSSRIFGPALAGLLIGLLGIAAVLYLNAASFLAVLAGLLWMDRALLHEAPRRPGGAMLAQVREGLRYIGRTPEILLVMILMAGIGTFGYNFSVSLPLIGGFILHTSAEQYGLLGTFLGVGSLLGAFVTAFAKRINALRLLLSAVAFSLLLGSVALVSSYLVSAAVLLTLGLAGVLFTTTASTLIQLRVPDELRGRVTSVYQLLFMGSTPIGGLLIGVLAHAFGVAVALLVCAGLCLASVVGAYVYWRRTAGDDSAGMKYE